MSERRRCAACRKQSMVYVGAAVEWSVTPPPIDADEYQLWRCETVTVLPNGESKRCGAEVKRKPDGSASRDPRWAEIIEIEGA